jgi:hypothetical protein
MLQTTCVHATCQVAPIGSIMWLPTSCRSGNLVQEEPDYNHVNLLLIVELEAAAVAVRSSFVALVCTRCIQSNHRASQKEDQSQDW